MADQDARAILLTIQANTELLRSNLSAAERAVDEFTRSTQEHLDQQDERFSAFGKSLESLEGPLERLKQLGEVAVGALLGESLIEAGKKALEFAGNIKFVSEQVGTSTDFLQKYRYAASQFGADTETSNQALIKFSRSVGEAANGNKSIIDLFDQLGVKVRDSGGNVRSVQSVFLDTANAISKVEDPAQRTADVMTLMGRGAGALVPLMSEGANGFNELAEAAQKLGVVLSPELIEHSEEVNHKLAALKEVVDAEMASTIAQNAAAIEKLAVALVKAAGATATYLNSHPEVASALLSGLAGLRLGGPVGGIVGGAVGAGAGEIYKINRDDADTSVPFRAQQFLGARDRYLAAQRQGALTPEQRSVAADSGVPIDDPSTAYSAMMLQYRRYMQAKAAPHPTEGNLGSDAPGATNRSDADLKKAQGELTDLEKGKAGASGQALAAYNEEITAKQRQIAFIKQGATFEMASSLAAKQGSIERQGEAKAREAARKAEEARQKALSQDRAYHGQLSQADNAIGEANLKVSDTPEARYEIEITRLRAQLADQDKEIADQVAAGKLTPARGLVLTAKRGGAEETNERAAGEDLSSSTAQNALNLDQDSLARKRELLDIDDQLATTQAQRRSIGLKLLEIDEQTQRDALTFQRDHAKTDADRKRAQASLDALPEQTAAKRTQVDRQTQGPGQSFLQGLSGQSLGEQLDGVKVDAIQQLSDSFEKAALGALHLHGALASIVGDLLKIAEQRIIEQPIANALFGNKSTGGGGGGGGFFGGLGKLLGLGGKGNASGGSGAAADSSIDPDLFAATGYVPGFAKGGNPSRAGNKIRGPGTGTSDSILAMLGKKPIAVSNGESIVTAEATKRFGPLIQAMNDNRLHGFAGGRLGSFTPASLPDMDAVGAARAAANAPRLTFDLRGAVMTQDLLNQMNGIASVHADSAAIRGAQGGAQIAATNAQQARRRSLVRG